MMITCKQCGKEKPGKEFPWLLQRVCHNCHMYAAMNWAKIPWPEKEKKPISEAKRIAIEKAAKTRRKTHQLSAYNRTDSTETKKTMESTLETF